MYEQSCYRNSFLKEVIAKIDFSSPVSQGYRTYLT